MAEKQGFHLSMYAESLTNLAMPMRELMRLPSDLRLLVVDQRKVRLHSDLKTGAQRSTALGADRIHDYSNVRNTIEI